MFSIQKVGFDIFEGEKHPEDVTVGWKGDSLPCPSRHASKSFEGTEEEYRYEDVENGNSRFCTNL